MSDSVKFIFMTLIKVPVIIFVAFFIFNIFAFFFIYFKVLGLSYVVMQEVVANNYITTSQANQINNYFKEIDKIPMVSNTNMIVGLSGKTDAATGKRVPVCYNKGTGMTVYADNMGAYAPVTGGTSAMTKTQYGSVKTIGVHCEYTIVWPLSYNNSRTASGSGGAGVAGYEGNGMYDNQDIEHKTETAYSNNMGAGDSTTRGFKITVPLNIYYKVPGLKYYADKG